jgi:hypothetical protein
MKTSHNFIDLSEKQFSSLYVEKLHHIDHNRRAHWLCTCKCFNQCVVSGTNLRKGNTKSCGCLRKGKAKDTIEKLYYHN